MQTRGTAENSPAASALGMLSVPLPPGVAGKRVWEASQAPLSFSAPCRLVRQEREFGGPVAWGGTQSRRPAKLVHLPPKVAGAGVRSRAAASLPNSLSCHTRWQGNTWLTTVRLKPLGYSRSSLRDCSEVDRYVGVPTCLTATQAVRSRSDIRSARAPHRSISPPPASATPELCT